ncbi:hypothetical protein SNEBB_006266 [Seison nebaliae]|nr:hypothetical protein SNEBB_006266 [Seison nebaliae]
MNASNNKLCNSSYKSKDTKENPIINEFETLTLSDNMRRTTSNVLNSNKFNKCARKLSDNPMLSTNIPFRSRSSNSAKEGQFQYQRPSSQQREKHVRFSDDVCIRDIQPIDITNGEGTQAFRNYKRYMLETNNPVLLTRQLSLENSLSQWYEAFQDYFHSEHALPTYWPTIKNKQRPLKKNNRKKGSKKPLDNIDNGKVDMTEEDEFFISSTFRKFTYLIRVLDEVQIQANEKLNFRNEAIRSSKIWRETWQVFNTLSIDTLPCVTVEMSRKFASYQINSIGDMLRLFGSSCENNFHLLIAFMHVEIKLDSKTASVIAAIVKYLKKYLQTKSESTIPIKKQSNTCRLADES